MCDHGSSRVRLCSWPTRVRSLIQDIYDSRGRLLIQTMIDASICVLRTGMTAHQMKTDVGVLLMDMEGRTQRIHQDSSRHHHTTDATQAKIAVTHTFNHIRSFI